MTQRRLRLLLAEGSPGEATAALHELYAGTDPGLDLTVVSTIATLLPTIKVVDPEVILLDLGLDLREPLDAVHLVHRTAPGAPLIVIADPAEKEQAIRSLAQGAMDYVLKGHIDTHTLERVLRTALERNTLTGLTDLLRDQVTGLYTRDGFLTVGARRHEEAMRGGSSLVLICVLFENLQGLREASGRGGVCDPRSGRRGTKRAGNAQPPRAAPGGAQSDALAMGTNRFADKHRLVDPTRHGHLRGIPGQRRVALAAGSGGDEELGSAQR